MKTRTPFWLIVVYVFSVLSMASEAQIFTNTTPVTGSLGMIYVEDGLGGVQPNVGINFYQATHVINLAEIGENKLHYSISVYASPTTVHYVGSNYDLTVSFEILGGVFDINGTANYDQETGHLYFPYFGAQTPIEGAFTWIVGNSTHTGTFAGNFGLGFSRDYSGHLLSGDFPDSYDFGLNTFGIDYTTFLQPSTRLNFATAIDEATGLQLNIGLVPQRVGNDWRLGYTRGYVGLVFPDQITIVGAPEPSVALVVFLGLIARLCPIRKRDVSHR